ncbi:ATP-dependent helicase [Nocardioides gansuensis]|uniref:DNA 3'-5' helicase n=1 Tax=Nocardioides gansuensis TaxID=2138300 RepID=A0A2T8FBP7_9ACTN|nr:ATP-dependent DNA helicase [Nocardioides gansuensis]PVG83139.1 ATP-dependent helicase [Nocardioides gansuensis]
MSTTHLDPPAYRLVRQHAPTAAPVLDAWQRQFVEHESGPLLVLAGPGTGKTTTLVEAIVERIEVRGADPSSVLALTFSRKAAEQLRDRVTARLGRTVATPLAATFHSFAFGLVRRFTPAELYSAPLRLLTAPQADVMVRELLDLHRDELPWPPGLAVAARTRGFAQEVSAVVARAREKGADHEQLLALGHAEQLPELVAAGIFLRHYLDNLDDHGATDYADLMRRAVIEAEAHRGELRRQLRHVFVDEYQDTDPGQVALLQAIAGDGGDLVVVGDPHQSIYGFRGADVRGLLDFPATFPTREGAKAPVVVLRTTRRFGADLLEASRRVAARLPLAGAIGEEARAAFASPVPSPDAPAGLLEVLTYDTDRAEVERIADLLRRAHLEDGLPWSDMAVLVRSGRATLPVMRRMLASAGVPVEVAGDEIPLVAEPAVRPLVDALAVVVASPEPPTPEAAEALLLSPLCGLDATAVRALGRQLRRRDLAEATRDRRPPRGSRELVAQALVDHDLLDGLEGAAVDGARRLVRLLGAALDALHDDRSVEEVLWGLWSGTSWAEHLRAGVARGGAAARRAHRDLDAICALFDLAARAEEQRGHTSAENFLAELQAQQIPGDTRAEKGVRGDAVRLLTAHRSKGLEWELVVVAHVQEGAWPDLRRRATLLGGDRIGAPAYGRLELQPDVTARALLAEERRLFYVACTRARRRLVVTAVSSTAEEGEQPSRFLFELVDEPTHLQGRPQRPLTLAGVVAELRRTASDDTLSDALRQAAARRLAQLAATEVAGRPLVPAADPAHWWGTHARTASATPVRPADEPLGLSASTITSIGECPARWFLEHEAGGATYSGQAAGFGNLVHKIAEHVGSGRLADADIDELMEHVDQVWDQLPFRTPWSRHKEREEARAAIERFLKQHRDPAARTIVATEHSFEVLATLPDGEQVRLRGFADRVELDAERRVVVVDLKTGKYMPTQAELAVHPQLGLYQLAVERGAVDGLLPDGTPGAVSGGAELWQLRTSTSDAPKVQTQRPQEPDEEGWLPVERQIALAAHAIRAEEFPARPSDKVCRVCSFQAMCPARTTKAVIQ